MTVRAIRFPIFIPSHSEKKKRIALFGALDGHIRNISLENCNVSGRYAAGIAAFGTRNSSVINCFVSGNISAEKRAGGIVDCTHGRVENCVSLSITKAEKEASGSISANYTGTIRNSFSSKGNEISVNDGMAIDTQTCDKLNNNLKNAGRIGISSELVNWSLNSNGDLTLVRAE